MRFIEKKSRTREYLAARRTIVRRLAGFELSLKTTQYNVIERNESQQLHRWKYYLLDAILRENTMTARCIFTENMSGRYCESKIILRYGEFSDNPKYENAERGKLRRICSERKCTSSDRLECDRSSDYAYEARVLRIRDRNAIDKITISDNIFNISLPLMRSIFPLSPT